LNLILFFINHNINNQKILAAENKENKYKRKSATEYSAKYSIEDLVLFTNDKDKNIVKLNNDLK